MTVTEEQANLFYELWIPLLDFVNRKRKIVKELYGMSTPQGLPVKPVMKIRDALWAHRELIDLYVAQNPNGLDAQRLAIVAAWKDAVQDDFVVLRHLQSGSILLPAHRPDTAYIARGLHSTWNELMQGSALPLWCKAVLLPYQNRIVTDSIVVRYAVRLVGNERRTVEDMYRAIKAAGGVRKTINGAPAR